MVERPLLKRSKLDASLKIPLLKLFTYYDKVDFVLLYAGILAAFVNGMCFPVLFFKIGDVTDKIDKYGDNDDDFYDEIVQVCWVLLALGGIAAVSGCIAYVCFALIGSRQGLVFRSRCMDAILHLKIGWFDQHLTADLAQTVDAKCRDIEQATGEKQLVIFYTVSFTLSAIGIALYSCSQVALVGLAEVPCYLVGLFLIYKATVITITEHGKDYQDAGQLADEALANHKYVSATNSQARISEEYRSRLERSQGKSLQVGLLQGLGMGIIWGTWLTVGGVIFWYGAFLAKDYHDDLIFQDQVDEGDVVTVFFVIGLMCLNFGNLMPSIEAIAKGQYAGYFIFSILGSAEVQREGQRLEAIDGRIEFRDVSFSYPTNADVQILKKVNFQLLPGQITYLNGESGSGKSTVASLIARFYDPTEGAVTLDGVNIKALDLQFLRANVSMVLKDPMIFNTSLFDNIHMGDLNAPREKVMEAAALAGIEEMARGLPNGLETIIQSQGTKLSFGEKQKLALARAYLKNAKILIVDSGTSALDSESEAQFYQAIEHLKSTDKTILFCSSRTYSRSMFDQSLTLKAANVTSAGQTESELESSYSRLTFQDFESVRLDTSSQKMREAEIERREESKQDSGNIQRSALLQTVRVMSKSLLWVGVIVLAASTAGAAFPLFGAMIGEEMHFFIDEDGDNMYSDCRNMALVMIFSSFVLFLAMTLLGLSVSKVGTVSAQAIRTQTFSKLMNYDEGFYEQPSNSPQRVSYVLSQDADKVQGYGAPLLALLLLVVAGLVCATVIEMICSWKLGLVIMACAPFLTASDLFSPMLSFFATKSTFYAQSNEIAAEATTNAKAIAAYNLRPRISSAYLASVQTNNRDLNQSLILYGVLYGVGLFVLYGVYALVFWYGAWLVREDDLRYENMLVATFTCVLTAYGMLMSFSFAPSMNSSRRSTNKIFNLTAYQPTIDITKETGQVRQIAGNFKLSQVGFAYSGQKQPSLKSISFEIPAHTVFGIWGRSGAGKSTLIQLLLRLYDPTSGSITVDGVDLSDLNLKTYRSHIAVAFQEPVLFNGSVRDNLAMEAEGKTEEDMIKAAQMTKAWDFLKDYPIPLDRDVGVRGTRLSPGQQQQIALTRALLRSPTVLILDEALSSMRAEEEVEVIRSIRAEWPEQTVILISHNRLVNMLAGQVVVLEQGESTKTGAPLDLVA